MQYNTTRVFETPPLPVRVPTAARRMPASRETNVDVDRYAGIVIQNLVECRCQLSWRPRRRQDKFSALGMGEILASAQMRHALLIATCADANPARINELFLFRLVLLHVPLSDVLGRLRRSKAAAAADT